MTSDEGIGIACALQALQEAMVAGGVVTAKDLSKAYAEKAALHADRPDAESVLIVLMVLLEKRFPREFQ